MLIRSMVYNQFGDNPQSPPVCLPYQLTHVVTGSVLRMHVVIVGNIIAVIPHGRGVEGQQPDGVDPQITHIIKFFQQSGKITQTILI